MKKCRYGNCLHDTIDINITIEDFHVESNRYYHADCWLAKQEEDRKKEEQKRQKEETKEQQERLRAEKKERNQKITNDRKLICDMWVRHINQTVVYKNLHKVITELLGRGIDSDYLVFTIQYCITHKLNLRNPGGIIYFADKQEIKDAYAQKQRMKNKISEANFTIPDAEDVAPSFNLNTKPSGFGKILGGG